MAPKSRSTWQKVGVLLIEVAFIALLGGIIAFRFGLFSWTGWTIIYSWTGFSTKNGWDWLQLLVIPGVLLVVGILLNQIQKRREERITQRQKEVEQAVATDNQQESLLQAYLDKMSELLVEKQLHKSEPEDEIRGIARVRTLTVLPRLDGPRKRSVLQFLHEAGLIDRDKHIIDLHGADLRATNFSGATLFGADLGGANLRGADLFAADLGGVDLRGANLFAADLRGAKLSGVNLFGTDLRGAYLGRVDLSGATLDGATLSNANLSSANLTGATLRGANLRGAILFGADLHGANLFGADLCGANLRGAYLGSVDLSEATLDGADLGDARFTTELEASTKDGASLKLPELPNADAKYARYRSTTRLRGPLRTFGGPLRIRLNVQYDPEEYTVAYIQRAKSVLVTRLILPVLLLFGLIISTFYFPSLALYIALAIFVLPLVIGYTILNYIDDVFILTTKRIIDIDRRFLFFNEEHLAAEYANIRDVTVDVGNPLFLALDVGTVIVQTAGDNPNIEISPADHPFSIQDMIFRIKNHMEKKEERKR